VLVDPLDVPAIASGIAEAIERRADLRERGLARARSFSWDAAAEQTLAVYREVA
jgi:glycosyltransferase involved in cell wall biosynthesis